MRSRVAVVGATMLVMLLLPASPALAFTPRAGSTVIVAQPISDDLYAAGGTVEVTGAVDGDIVAVGGTLTLSGPATGGILAAGGTVAVRGRVERSVRAAGGQVSVGGPVGSDAVLAGGTVTVEQAAEIARDLVIAGGSINVLGRVGDDASLTAGSIVIGGAIGGDVEAHADRIVLLPGARISGTLRYSAETELEIQPGAQVSGQVTRVARPSRSRTMLNPAARLGFRFAGRVLEALWLFVIGLILIAVAPRAVRRVTEQVTRRFGMSLLTGFILLVVVPVAAVLLLITVVGIPTALVVMLLYFATLYPSQVFVATWLGEWILGRFGRAQGVSPYLTLALGAVILVFLIALPFVGWVLRLLALFVGFGALWAAIWHARTKAAEPARASG